MSDANTGYGSMLMNGLCLSKKVPFTDTHLLHDCAWIRDSWGLGRYQYCPGALVQHSLIQYLWWLHSQEEQELPVITAAGPNNEQQPRGVTVERLAEVSMTFGTATQECNVLKDQPAPGRPLRPPAKEDPWHPLLRASESLTSTEHWIPSSKMLLIGCA